MASDDQPDPARSGSRWEPTEGPPPGDDEPTEPIATNGSAAASEAETTAEQRPVTESAVTGSQDSPPPATPTRGRRMIGIPVASAVAAGLVVVSGLGGYALGAATTAEDLTPVSDGRADTPFPGFPDDPDGDGFRGDFDDDGPDFDDDGPDFDDDGPDFDDDGGSDSDDSGEET